MHKPSGWMDDNHGHLAPGRPQEGGTPAVDWPRRHPVRSWRLPVSAGGDHAHVGEGDGDDYLACPVPCDADTFVLQVRGASMEPLFSEGDFIFVDPRVRAASGHYIVVGFDDRDEATLRQLLEEDGLRVLRAVHPNWPQALAQMGDDAIVFGVVVFKGRQV